MTSFALQPESPPQQLDVSIGRIVSVTGAKAIVLLDGGMANSEKRGFP